MPEWLLYAIASVVCWGLVNVLDSYFVESEIYNNMWDGMIVSSMFKLTGVLLIGGFFFTKVIEISFMNAILSMLGGALISGAYMSCFAAMLYYNDSPLIQVVWMLSSPLVVILGYFFLGEEFASKSYIGMGIVFLGAFVTSFQKDSFECELGKFARLLIPMVILYSVSEVLMKYVEEGQGVEFGQSFPFLCLGQALFGVILFIIRRNPRQIGRIIKENWRLFFSGEALEMVGLFLMQLAIAKTPSISLFGVVEAFMPIAVILLTGILVFLLEISERSSFILRIFKGSPFLLRRGNILKKVYEKKMLSALPVKIIATAIVMIGVYFI